MVSCTRCGEENPDRARFCLNCANPLAAEAHAAETRRTVTILFADVVNSTGRGEATDPESTRRTLARYFEAMRGALERHGGTVEKFIGDAVMAVFGIPTIHEDDALRAVRAAHDMTRALDELNAELVGSGSEPISVRVGVNTGEVVTGDPAVGQTLVTGDAVNVAARLEQAAGAGEVLMGAATYRLVRYSIGAEPVAPLDLKGKALPVHAFRLLSVTGVSEPGRRHDTPLVARERELRMLNEALERAVSDQGCHLFTLLGAAGVGKSRLVHEFLNGARETAQIMRARCLPYGDGITFWPIVELTQSAAGIELTDAPEAAITKLRQLVGDVEGGEAIVERVATAIGLTDNILPGEEIFWGVRKLLETIARRRPLVVVIDDLHWAELTLLDLVEHIADLSREAPILLLAIARPELLDVRSHWGGGKMNAVTILLEPLTSEQSVALVTNLVGDASLARILQEHVGETAEGNPLFVEELVAMLIDEGVLRHTDEGWVADADLEHITVPPTVAALVAARLDRLEAPERDLVGRASVVGKIFQRSAVLELSPPERRPELGTRLMNLVRKEVVRPDRSGEIGNEAFRFRHILVRDAAYGSLPKEQRAELHAHFADWLERLSGDRLHEYQEVIAYHLEQAHDSRAELGLTDATTRELGNRAAGYLRAAGLRASTRRDLTAAVSLLSRAARLVDDDRERAEIFLALAEATGELGDLAGGFKILDEARAAALRAGDELRAMRAQLMVLGWQQLVDPAASEDPLIALTDELQERGEAAGDLRAVIDALARGQTCLYRCLWADQLAELNAATTLIQRMDDPWLERAVQVDTLNAVRHGPMPASTAIEQFEATPTPSPEQMPIYPMAAPLYAMQGRFDEARRVTADAKGLFAERGVRLRLGTVALPAGTAERISGDLGAAEREWGIGVEILQSLGETGVLSTIAAMRALVLHALDRPDDAMASVELARETGAPHDIATQAIWRCAAAKVAADRGEMDTAERLAGEAAALVEPTDFSEMRADAYETAAYVAARAGRRAEAAGFLQRAVDEHVGKQNIVDAARVRRLLEAHTASQA